MIETIQIEEKSETHQDCISHPSPEEAVDLLFKVINRFDFYTNSTNAKTSLIIAWNSFVFGAVLLKYDDILNLFPLTGSPHYAAISLATVIGICSIISNIFAFLVIFPFLKPNSTNTSHSSLFFFGSVSWMSVPDFSARISDASFKTIISDLTDQAVTIASGLSNKMTKLQNSIRAIYLGLIAAGGLLALKAILSF